MLRRSPIRTGVAREEARLLMKNLARKAVAAAPAGPPRPIGHRLPPELADTNVPRSESATVSSEERQCE